MTSCPAYVITETAVHILIKGRKSLKDFIQGRKQLDINSILGCEGRRNPPNPRAKRTGGEVCYRV